ncbi:unnamed protein product (macronuclear) [Paramecium tetraurelia]|uniref:Uncharacterized protein n=1 Tax=Paramecium tetraurelia TaxID=5888 RepID=A0BC61_PARTE|nr:uncharacterized protein GSPATT00000564001 [Paramecium tetraurelia]CAK56128.1 unnamed protein product [Paramecium tetraurelia]|eukprot:XP_001423526.1 hypothetical protein (macronuclear) [Paramecium tetraurelia strain d4-2]
MIIKQCLEIIEPKSCSSFLITFCGKIKLLVLNPCKTIATQDNSRILLNREFRISTSLARGRRLLLQIVNHVQLENIKELITKSKSMYKLIGALNDTQNKQKTSALGNK